MREQLLHFIWNELLFDFRNLKTANGQTLNIIKGGNWNLGDGPDFRKAVIEVDHIRFFGDIELHIESDAWFTHHHDTDPHYKNVILHVVLHDRHYRSALRNDGTHPFGLILEPYLTEHVHTVIRRMSESQMLACAGQIASINTSIIRKQLDRSATEYFQEKVDKWLNLYDNNLKPSHAIRRLLVLSMFDGLGIADNRNAMRSLFHQLVKTSEQWLSLPVADRIEYAMNMAGLTEKRVSGTDSITWNYSSTRPNNHPQTRIPQAMIVFENIAAIPFDEFLTADINALWEKILTTVDGTPPIGKERAGILFHTCFLPVMYLTGSLFQIQKRMDETQKLWNRSRPKLADSIVRPFLQSGFPEPMIRCNFGSVYQLKHYCRQRKCEECNIMKAILLS